MNHKSAQNRFGGTAVNLLILLVVIIGAVVGVFLYGNRTRPFSYESSGNVIEFKNVDLARDCAKVKDLDFELNGFDIKFNGLYTGTRGLIELHTGFELKLSGMVSGSKPTLPFSKSELIKKIQEVVDEKLENGCVSKVVELSVQNLKEGPEGETKDDEQKKTESSDSSDVDSNDDDESKDDTKDETKDDAKDETKDDAKDETKDDAKEKSKDNAKDESKDESKDEGN